MITRLLASKDYLAPGSYFVEGALGNDVSENYTIPAGVYSICAVCVGGGSSGEATGFNGTSETGDSDGGGGGNLRWRNNISVTPGMVITIVAGRGGDAPTVTADASGIVSSVASMTGRSSYIEIDGVVVLAAGGAGSAFTGVKTSPDTPIGNGVGGGDGGSGENGSDASRGGGGNAGRYLGDGGNAVSSGAGSRLYGVDANGLEITQGVRYGGGGAGDADPPLAGATDGPSNGGAGGVRIIWGSNVSFPYDANF